MRSGLILVLLTLVILFGPWAIEFNLRIAIVAVLASISFYFYMRHKVFQWRRRGLNPATVLIGRILGAILGACAAMLGGALARLSMGSTPAAEALVLAPLEMLAGAVFGVLLGSVRGANRGCEKQCLDRCCQWRVWRRNWRCDGRNPIGHDFSADHSRGTGRRRRRHTRWCTDRVLMAVCPSSNPRRVPWAQALSTKCCSRQLGSA